MNVINLDNNFFFTPVKILTFLLSTQTHNIRIESERYLISEQSIILNYVIFFYFVIANLF